MVHTPAGVTGAAGAWFIQTAQLNEHLWGNRTLQTQDTSVRRHFGTCAEVSGQFGPKTLRHQDISALVSGHFGTNAWTLRHYNRMPLETVQ